MSDYSIDNNAASLLFDLTGQLQWVEDEFELKRIALDGLLRLGWSWIRLYRYDEGSGNLISEASRGFREPKHMELFDQGHIVIGKDSSDNYHWSSFERGEPLVVRTTNEPLPTKNPDWDEKGRFVLLAQLDRYAVFLEKDTIAEWAEVPLVSRSHIVGKLTAGKTPSQVISSQDFFALTVLSRMFAQVVERMPEGKPSWERFEDEVAAILRGLGANVKQQVNLAGSKVDVLATEQTGSGQALRTVVECKDLNKKIGLEVLRSFTYTVSILRQKGDADRGMMVSRSGFTQDAHLLSANSGVELLMIGDLLQRLGNRSPVAAPQDLRDSDLRVTAPPKLFVVMPFSTEFDDVYHLGIRETAETIGCVCERADELEFTGSILKQIASKIQSTDIVVAELTQPNPNVYYEIGMADALKKPVIRLTRNAKDIPFDQKDFNHILYGSIRELRGKLKKSIKAILES